MSKNVFKISKNKINVPEAIKILEDFNLESKHTDTIFDPEGDEIFLFYKENGKLDYKCDGYRWRNQSYSNQPEEEPVVKITYYKAITDKEMIEGNGVWKKRTFMLIGKPLPILIQYEGSGENFPPPKHGNTKKPEQASNFSRTLPSMLDELKVRLENRMPAEVYRSLTQDEKTRNKKVCSNVRQVRIVTFNLC